MVRPSARDPKLLTLAESERLVVDAQFADQLAWPGLRRSEGQPHFDARNVARQQQDALGFELVERVERLELLGAGGELGTERRRIAAHVHVDQVAGDDFQPQMPGFDALRRDLDRGDKALAPEPRGGVVADVAHHRNRSLARGRPHPGKQVADDRRELGTVGAGEVHRRDVRAHVGVAQRARFLLKRIAGFDPDSRRARLLGNVGAFDFFAARRWRRIGLRLRCCRTGVSSEQR